MANKTTYKFTMNSKGIYLNHVLEIKQVPFWSLYNWKTVKYELTNVKMFSLGIF